MTPAALPWLGPGALAASPAPGPSRHLESRPCTVYTAPGPSRHGTIRVTLLLAVAQVPARPGTEHAMMLHEDRGRPRPGGGGTPSQWHWQTPVTEAREDGGPVTVTKPQAY